MRQIPGYPDKAPLAHGEDILYRFPPLVFTGEGARFAAVAAQRARLHLRSPPHNFREN
jgi:3-deoxy-D-arabino-heptulosonate 7-phosphate (DAHP) synthase class II